MFKTLLLVCSTAVVAGAVVAPAEAGDERRCVSKREYSDVRHGWRQARVANHFDMTGVRLSRWVDESGYRDSVWKYRKCRAWGPGGWYVGVGYDDSPDDDDPYMRVWIKCARDPEWIVYDGQCSYSP